MAEEVNLRKFVEDKCMPAFDKADKAYTAMMDEFKSRGSGKDGDRSLYMFIIQDVMLKIFRATHCLSDSLNKLMNYLLAIKKISDDASIADALNLIQLLLSSNTDKDENTIKQDKDTIETLQNLDRTIKGELLELMVYSKILKRLMNYDYGAAINIVKKYRDRILKIEEKYKGEEGKDTNKHLKNFLEFIGEGTKIKEEGNAEVWTPGLRKKLDKLVTQLNAEKVQSKNIEKVMNNYFDSTMNLLQKIYSGGKLKDLSKRALDSGIEELKNVSTPINEFVNIRGLPNEKGEFDNPNAINAILISISRDIKSMFEDFRANLLKWADEIFVVTDLNKRAWYLRLMFYNLIREDSVNYSSPATKGAIRYIMDKYDNPETKKDVYKLLFVLTNKNVKEEVTNSVMKLYDDNTTVKYGGNGYKLREGLGNLMGGRDKFERYKKRIKSFLEESDRRGLTKNAAGQNTLSLENAAENVIEWCFFIKTTRFMLNFLHELKIVGESRIIDMSSPTALYKKERDVKKLAELFSSIEIKSTADQLKL